VNLKLAKLLGVPLILRFVLVELGVVAPTVIASMLAGYIISLNLYLIPEYLTGPGLTTLGFLVQQSVLQSFDLTLASAQSLLLVAVAVVPLAIGLWAEWALRR
jgi:ABC-type spermidine/putrescine transport system permease subunit I